MQRRRKPKSEPRNIFDKSSGGKPPKSTLKNRRDTGSEKSRRPGATPPPAPVTSKPPTIPKATKKSKSGFPFDISGCGVVGQKISKK